MRFAPAAIFSICLTVPGTASALDLSFEAPVLKFAQDGLFSEQATLEFSDTDEKAPEVMTRVNLGFRFDEERRGSYASAGIEFPFGEIDLGRPRSILDGGPLPSGAPGVPMNLRPLVDEAALNETLSAGVRLAARQGPVLLGTSVHTLEDSGLSIIGVAGRYDTSPIGALDNVAVYGGAETDGQEEQYRLGTEFTRGRATAGINVLRSNENEGRTLSQVYLGLSVNPSISLGVSGERDADVASDTTETRFGLGASLETDSGTFVEGGVNGFTNDDPEFGVSVGFQF